VNIVSFNVQWKYGECSTVARTSVLNVETVCNKPRQTVARWEQLQTVMWTTLSHAGPAACNNDFTAAPRPAPVMLLVASQYVLPGYSDRWVWVQHPGWLDHFCQVIAAYALRLNSRAGTEVSSVSSLNCDHRLIVALEVLSHQRNSSYKA